MTTNESPGDLSTRVLVEIRDEIRTLRVEHGGLLREHGELLRDHSRQLGELRTDVDGLRGEVGGLHGEVGGLRAEVGGLRAEVRELRLGQERLGANVNQILQALESGASLRDDRVVDLERRVDRLEDRAGLPR